MDPESQRLQDDTARKANWKRWGPYLAQRQWGTVREDYSTDGSAWSYFPHDHARSRAYRWGEDGILGLTDRECRLCFALALWNGRDPILKERMFGLTNQQGNHGEDVKEEYFYIDNTPTHSYFKGLYKYPQAEFPYERLIQENARRSRQDPEFELIDTGIFDQNRYFDVYAEYAKAGADDILIRITLANRGPDPAQLHFLPTLWFRNTWTWGCRHEGCWLKPRIDQADRFTLRSDHESLGKFDFAFSAGPDGKAPDVLFTDNETNLARLYRASNPNPYVKDAFGEFLIHKQAHAINPRKFGTKAAPLYPLTIGPGQQIQLKFRLYPENQKPADSLGSEFDRIFDLRIKEADQFYSVHLHSLSPIQRPVARQAFAGLLWNKQFYHYIIRDWLDGDPNEPPPPVQRCEGRNSDWPQVYSRDVMLMPDNWEYPWFAAWDLAFHTMAIAPIDPDYAKSQLLLLLREWYMHPNGELPAYEWNFGDVNPPMHAWAAWRIYKMTAPRGQRDRLFLERVFQKLLLNFTWWVNRKDIAGKHVFAGGFLGLDNIGVFDRSKPLPGGGRLEQADGTAWMAFYCATMLSIALELASCDPAYEDIASKFFEHFVAIADAMNTLGGTGLWDNTDGFYYDRLFRQDSGEVITMRVRSLVGLIPLITAEVLDLNLIHKLTGFGRRMNWFLEHRKDLAQHITYMEVGAVEDQPGKKAYLLAVPSRERLVRVLKYMLDESEFLSPFGIRSLSRIHGPHPFIMKLDGREHRVDYEPGYSTTGLFGGNSNWRGPIWFPVNFLLAEAMERYHHFFGDDLKVECPVGSGKMLNLQQVACEIARRATSIFHPGQDGHSPWQGRRQRLAADPHWKDLILFNEYFHGETGEGLGANHQTGWTALVGRMMRVENQA